MQVTSLLFLVLLSLEALALETDNYLAWNRELKDASSKINLYINQGIQKALEKKSATCLEVTRDIGEEFESHWVHDNPVENHLMQVLDADADEIYPQDMNYVAASIYRDPYLFYIPKFGLAPNIQVKGYYFGTDKLSHFASTGRLYFNKYQQALKLGLSERSAEIRAIQFGILDEKSLHGFWASGVFSYADLESNYQGFLFYRRLCSLESSKNYLQKTDSGWRQVKLFAIQDYVNGYWDETFYPSYFKPKNWQKIRPSLRSYCSKLQDKTVLSRQKYYLENSRPSFSMEFISAQMKANAKLLPDPSTQSLKKLCQP